MLFFAIIISALIVYLIQSRYFEKHAFDKINYGVTLSAEEVFEGDDVFLYEEIANDKNLPIPSAQVNTSLPEGLYFRLFDRGGDLTTEAGRAGAVKAADIYKSDIQSVFVISSHQTIRRRWRVNCKKRGVYELGGALMVVNDLIGVNTQSKRVDLTPSPHDRIVVLPKAVNLDDYFTSSFYQTGERIVPRSLSTDPLMLCGSREYTISDPMNKVNWKSTAAHGRLMVNLEEYTRRDQFNIILNMQSRDIEARPETPSTPQYIEECITVAASLLDMISASNTPVRLFINTPPSSIGAESVSDDEVGGNVVVTRAYQGQRDMIDALRLLASLEMKISVSPEKMLDHVLNHLDYYTNGGNIVVVSPYINERMLIFDRMASARGVRVCFYITTTFQNALAIPADVEVHYRGF